MTNVLIIPFSNEAIDDIIIDDDDNNDITEQLRYRRDALNQIEHIVYNSNLPNDINTIVNDSINSGLESNTPTHKQIRSVITNIKSVGYANEVIDTIPITSINMIMMLKGYYKLLTSHELNDIINIIMQLCKTLYTDDTSETINNINIHDYCNGLLESNNILANKLSDFISQFESIINHRHDPFITNISQQELVLRRTAIKLYDELYQHIKLIQGTMITIEDKITQQDPERFDDVTLTILSTLKETWNLLCHQIYIDYFIEQNTVSNLINISSLSMESFRDTSIGRLLTHTFARIKVIFKFMIDNYILTAINIVNVIIKLIDKIKLLFNKNKSENKLKEIINKGINKIYIKCYADKMYIGYTNLDGNQRIFQVTGGVFSTKLEPVELKDIVIGGNTYVVKSLTDLSAYIEITSLELTKSLSIGAYISPSKAKTIVAVMTSLIDKYRDSLYDYIKIGSIDELLDNLSELKSTFKCISFVPNIQALNDMLVVTPPPDITTTTAEYLIRCCKHYDDDLINAKKECDLNAIYKSNMPNMKFDIIDVSILNTLSVGLSRLPKKIQSKISSIDKLVNEFSNTGSDEEVIRAKGAIAYTKTTSNYINFILNLITNTVKIANYQYQINSRGKLIAIELINHMYDDMHQK